MCQEDSLISLLEPDKDLMLNNLREPVDTTGFEYYTPERIIADGMAKEIYDGTNGNNQSKISTVDNSRCSCKRCQEEYYQLIFIRI